MKKEGITIAGINVGLRLLGKSELKGIPIDAALGYHFYEAQFRGYPFLLLEAQDQRKLSPLQYLRLAGHIQAIKGLPCVFLFQSLPTYERNRLIERGVYFVMGDKYVFLPFLLVNTREEKVVKTDKLLPAAQYLLLYHLQVRDLTGESLMTLEQKLPYKYVTLSRAVRQAEAMGLLECHAGVAGEKILHFPPGNEQLWMDAELLMQIVLQTIWLKRIILAGCTGLFSFCHLCGQRSLVCFGGYDYGRTCCHFGDDFFSPLYRSTGHEAFGRD